MPDPKVRGTEEPHLLHKMRDDGVLPQLSERLGQLTRTNSESLVGVITGKAPDERDFTHGVAITSSFFPDSATHIEPVRYGKGSNAMFMLGTVMSDGADGVPRWKQWVKAARERPSDVLQLANVRGASERGIIALVMQNVNNSITVFGERTRSGRFRLRSKQGEGEPNPSWIPVANDAMRRLARILKGRPMGNWGEVIDAPMTAHFIGGAVIGLTPQDGVIARRLALDVGPLPASKTLARIFDLSGLPCDGITGVLLNDLLACGPEPEGRSACLPRIATSSRVQGVSFDK